MEATMTNVEIINYTPKYRNDFKRINAEWMPTHLDKKMGDHLDNPEESIIRKGGFVLFAKNEGEIVGTCAILKENTKLYEIADMTVAPQYRGKHIGKRLLFAAIDTVRKAGARQVYLVTNDKLAAAIALYRTYGFKELGVDVESSVDEGADVKMVLNLK